MGMLKKVISLWSWFLPWGTLWYIWSLYDHKSILEIFFSIFRKKLPVSWQKLILLQRLSCWKKLFPFEVDVYHEGIFGECLSMLWFVNESFDFFYLLMAIFSLLEWFATFNKLFMIEWSIAVRRACFLLLWS